MDFILHGQFYYAGPDGSICCMPDGWGVCLGGVSAGVYPSLPPQYAHLPVRECGDALILPGLCDLHLHAPQYPYRALGMDLELLDWLEQNTFPEETRYRDPAYAAAAYRLFADDLTRSFTTRAAVFATAHTEATWTLMDLLEDTGLITLVGRVSMDRGCPEDLREPDARQALAETVRWLDGARQYERTRPILTPRFVPSCTDELLAGLGKLAQQRGLPVQSHLSENPGEIRAVAELCPWASCYGEVYHHFGLMETPHIMAHCVHSGAQELDLLARQGTFIAHCPESNMNVSSGVAPVSQYLDRGLHVGLATDVAGGSSTNMFQALTHAVQASKLRWRLLDQNVRRLNFADAFVMATLGSGAFWGKVGSFAPGYAFDALVLDDTALHGVRPRPLAERVEQAAYLGGPELLTAKYVAGRLVYGK